MEFKVILFTCWIASLMLMMGKVGAITSQSSIVLENGGYTNVVVAIDDRIEEHDDLIPGIKKMFIDGSRYLHQATRNRVYFKSITILVPSHWSTNPEYVSPGRLTYDVADVIVAPPNPLWAPDPYTLQVQGCGKPGRYIHFVEDFFTSSNVEDRYGNPGRVLVHEWGHLRWGLFNEYPDPVADQTHVSEFYQSSEDGKWKPVACSSGYDIRAIIPDNSPNAIGGYRNCEGNEDDGYENRCLAYAAGSETSTGSIMYGKLIYDKIVNFCDNNTSEQSNLHNREAPNKHNRLCGSRSAWEVMREHDDFKSSSPVPPDLGEGEILPTFTIAQARGVDDCRIVIVIDTSGSMGTSDRIEKAKSASSVFINLVKEGTWVGLVTFVHESVIRHPLVQVLSERDRNSLLQPLKNIAATGGTCIGCGLETGHEVLQQHPSGDLAGGDIILMTDGEDGGFASHPIRQTLITDGIRVNTVAIGEGADIKLNTVAEETGGLPFYIADDDVSGPEFITSLTQTADRCSAGNPSQGRVQLFAEGFSLGVGERKSGRFSVDSFIGSGTQVFLTYTHGSDSAASVTLILTEPNGRNITTGDPEYNENAQMKVISISIVGTAETGDWLYTIVNGNFGSQTGTIVAYSRPNVDEDQTEGSIAVTSYTSDSILNQSEDIQALVTYAEVRKGTRPVLNATVKATVERPGDHPITYDLLDNGAGADVTANDGVYTRSFLDYSGQGQYGIGITAENDGNAVVLGGSSGSRIGPFINITEDGRVVSGGSIGDYNLRLPGDPILETLEFEKAPSFTRSSSAGSTNVPSLPPSFMPGQDLFPPNRIQDLRVKMTSIEDISVVLTWTAPGDDLDTGTAMSYDIKMSQSSAALLADFSNATIIESWRILKGNTSSPKPFGSIEEYVVKVPDFPTVTSFSYAFALRATDDAGKTSPVSNVVVATFRRVIPTAPPIGPCDGMVCHNGGTLDKDNCSCSCLNEVQGKFCEHVKTQLRNGVQIDLKGKQAQWLESVGPLRASVTEQMNVYCTNNFGKCCPGRGNIPSGSVVEIEFVTTNEVRVADGYPLVEEKGDEDGLYKCSFVVYALKPVGPDICSDASGPMGRFRRDSTVNRRSVEQTYISQALLHDAVLSGSEAIAAYLTNKTSQDISIANITLPVVEEIAATSDEPRGSNRLTIILVVVCILVVVTGVIILVVAYFYKRCKKNASYQPARKAEPEEA